MKTNDCRISYPITPINGKTYRTVSVFKEGQEMEQFNIYYEDIKYTIYDSYSLKEFISCLMYHIDISA